MLDASNFLFYMLFMPARTITAPNFLTRPRTSTGDWALRFERDGDFYRLRAPLGATVELTPYRKLVLEDAINGVPAEDTAAKCAELLSRPYKPSSLANPLREVTQATRSKTISETACKAIVLGAVDLKLEVVTSEKLRESHLAVLAARGAGYMYADMGFLDPSEGMLTSVMKDARIVLGAPDYGTQANMMGRTFAVGGFVAGEAYVPDPPFAPLARNSC
jgi:hypothetical protein